ncbi:LysE family translocator [Flavobacteriaceae bacterium]|jgi:threonine/homoserine/homoserine lactone efflux protein|nr:LysE family translocator [Flavobacteriaceae bacterium]MDC1535060.1 LysE family translocator [Flavobacteriaceae bacterium]
MITDLFTAFVIGFGLSFVIGPVFFVLIETSITKGFRAAISLNLGVVFADVVFIVFCYLTSKQLVENIKNQPGLLVLGGAILVLYGAFIFIQRNKEDKRIHLEESPTNYFGLFVKGFALNIINIAVLLFWAGVIFVAVPNLNRGSSVGVIAFFATILSSYFLVDVVKIFIAKKLSSKINTDRTAIIKIILSIILFVSGAILIFTGSVY